MVRNPSSIYSAVPKTRCVGAFVMGCLYKRRRDEERATDQLKLSTIKSSYIKNKCSKMPVTDFITHATHRDALPRRHEPKRAAVSVVLHHTALLVHGKVHAAMDTTGDWRNLPPQIA